MPHDLSPGQSPDRRSGAYTGTETQRAALETGLGQAYGQHQQLSLPVLPGRIVQVVPFARTYSVRVAGDQDYTCSGGMMGQYGAGCLQNGMGVLIAAFPGSRAGVIIALNPDADPGGAASNLPGAVALGSGPLGIASPMYDAYKNQPGVGGIIPLHDHAPVDNLPGDEGVLNALDVGWIVSFGMMMMRASDTAAVEVYAFDSLLRLHGHNYERFAAGYERRQFDDEGEVHDVEFGAKFPWEGDGLAARGSGAWIAEPAESWGAYKASVEPRYPDQTGAWRLQTLRGYLGDMVRQQVLRQPDSRRTEPARYLVGDDGPAALSDVHYAADGAVHVRSAKEILFQKYVLIPAAEQTALPDDNLVGDGRANYRASGELGDGPEPQGQDEYQWGDDIRANKKAAALGEYVAHATNYRGPANLLGHAHDWAYRNEGAPSSGWDLRRTAIAPEKLNELGQKYWAGLPEHRDIAVDSRLKKVRYYESAATFAVTDDGGIVIEDAWGSSIHLCRGNIVLSCPGDILLNPGRRFVAQAGLDAVVRARNGVDLTTTEGDIRIKADRNLHALAGNDRADGSGGILFESRASATTQNYDRLGEGTVSSGIVFLAKKAQVAAIGGELYLGATGGASGGPAITLDASRAKRPIYVDADQILRKAETFIDRYGDSDAFAVATEKTWFTQAETLIVEGDIIAAKRKGARGHVCAENSLYARGSMRVDGSVVAMGSIASNSSMYAQKGIGKLGKSSMVGGVENDPFKDYIAQVDVGFASAVAAIHGMAAAAQNVEKAVSDAVRDDDNFGGDNLINKIAFSLRTDADYAAADFSIFEPAWLANPALSTDVWKEKPVRSSVGGDTYPFPGRKHYEERGSLLAAARRLFDVAAGRAADRGAIYKEKPPDDEEKSLNDYRVTKVQKEEV